jgi:hypothetical protein
MGKNGRILLDRPKPTVGCSASGRREEEEGLRLYGVFIIRSRVPPASLLSYSEPDRWYKHVHKVTNSEPRNH